jgi:hypothetical protein
MTISLAFLAPKLVRAAVEGRLPRGINIERLRDAPGDGVGSRPRSDVLSDVYCGLARERGMERTSASNVTPTSLRRSTNSPIGLLP